MIEFHSIKAHPATKSMWIAHPRFIDVVSKTWLPNADYLSCLRNFQCEATNWDKHSFSNIFWSASLKGI